MFGHRSFGGAYFGGRDFGDGGDAAPPIPTPAEERSSGGYWPDYGQPRRRRRVSRETQAETPEQALARMAQVAAQIKAAAEVRRAEAKSRAMTEEIRALLDERDRVAGQIVAVKAELAKDDEEALALI